LHLDRHACSSDDTVVWTGAIDEEEYEGSGLIRFAVAQTTVPPSLSVSPGDHRTFRFISSRVTSFEIAAGIDALAREALMRHSIAVEQQEFLLEAHSVASSELATAGIFVDGNHELARAVNATFYALRTSSRGDWKWPSLSPGGLSTNGYWGNLFWDSDTWQYPNLLLFHQDFARAYMQYRFDVRDGATRNAHLQGNVGYQFPWQSAVTGQEVCYNTIYEYNELHISGDVAQAMWQFWRATGDGQWLQDVGEQVLRGVATFWAGRVRDGGHSHPGQYVIDHVMCPDEDADDVSNSVYTNAIAQAALRWAHNASLLCGLEPADNWTTIADRLYIPFDGSAQMHPEFEGYDGREVKQADVVLLGYPLMYPMTDAVKRNDLEYYAARTRQGPAMTWAMFTVGHIAIGDFEGAAQAFAQTWHERNPSGPFLTWGEYAGNGGCPNFLTGGGGFLQSIWAGWAGLRLTDAALTLQPLLPPNTTGITLSELNYQGSRLHVAFDAHHVSITLTLIGPQPLYANSKRLSIEPVKFSYGSFVSISKSRSPTPQPSPTPKPAPLPTPVPMPMPSPVPSPFPSPSPSPSNCPPDAQQVTVGGQVECLWISGTGGLTIPSNARQYCGYVSRGYIGYTWDSLAGDHSCASSARKSSSGSTNFCVWEDGSLGVSIPSGSTADCGSLSQGRIGWRLPSGRAWI